MNRIISVFMLLCFCGCSSIHLKPLPPVDHSDPNVWTEKQCKDVPKVWWGVQGSDPSKWGGWHCNGWKIYSKDVAP